MKLLGGSPRMQENGKCKSAAPNKRALIPCHFLAVLWKRVFFDIIFSSMAPPLPLLPSSYHHGDLDRWRTKAPFLSQVETSRQLQAVFDFYKFRSAYMDATSAWLNIRNHSKEYRTLLMKRRGSSSTSQNCRDLFLQRITNIIFIF